MTPDYDDELLVHAAARRRLKGDYRVLFEGVSAILFRHNPIGLDFETNIDEYDPETGTILPRLRTCKSASDVQAMLYEEFVRWFASDLAGPMARYASPAADIWALWQERGATRPTP